MEQYYIRFIEDGTNGKVGDISEHQYFSIGNNEEAEKIKQRIPDVFKDCENSNLLNSKNKIIFSVAIGKKIFIDGYGTVNNNNFLIEKFLDHR